MATKCTAFKINERIDADNFHSVATVEIQTDGWLKGFYVGGTYNARTNTFHPDILGDSEVLEDYYDEIQEAVEGRNL